MTRNTLHPKINLLGACYTAAYSILSLLSYIQAPALEREDNTAQAAAFFEGLVADFPIVASHRIFTSNIAIILSYWIPIAAAGIFLLLVIRLLYRHAAKADASTVDLLLKWSLVFAFVSALAFPVFTPDFWVSAEWGRMLAAGINPYHNLFEPDFLRDLPLDSFVITHVTPYGPLWSLICAGVMAITGPSVLASAALFKLLLLAAWVSSLFLIAKITEASSVQNRCLAVAIFGWTPLSTSLSLAEGHNDVIMMAFALLWFFLLLRDRSFAPIALVGSVLCKYVTAPLFVIDLIYKICISQSSLRDYLMRMLPAALIGLGLFALFYRSPQFFDGLLVGSTWYFLRPVDAISGLEDLSGMRFYPIKLAVAAVIPTVCIYYLVISIATPTLDNITKASTSLMASIMFTLSHLWPWYVIWGLAFAAMVPKWWLSRFVVGVAIFAPFTVIAWWVEFDNRRSLTALAMYTGAVLWTFLTYPDNRVVAEGGGESRDAAKSTGGKSGEA